MELGHEWNGSGPWADQLTLKALLRAKKSSSPPHVPWTMIYSDSGNTQNTHLLYASTPTQGWNPIF